MPKRKLKEKCNIALDKKGRIKEIRGVCKAKDFKKQIKKIRKSFSREIEQPIKEARKSFDKARKSLDKEIESFDKELEKTGKRYRIK